MQDTESLKGTKHRHHSDEEPSILHPVFLSPGQGPGFRKREGTLLGWAGGWDVLPHGGLREPQAFVPETLDLQGQ